MSRWRSNLEMPVCLLMEYTSTWTFITLSGIIPAQDPLTSWKLAPLTFLNIFYVLYVKLNMYICLLNSFCTFVHSQLLFSILDILRTEAKILEGLHNLGIRGSSVSKFLHLPSSTAVEDSYALDIRHSSIMVRC